MSWNFYGETGSLVGSGGDFENGVEHLTSFSHIAQPHSPVNFLVVRFESNAVILNNEVEIGAVFDREDGDAFRLGMFDRIVQAFLENSVDSQLSCGIPVAIQNIDLVFDFDSGTLCGLIAHSANGSRKTQALEALGAEVGGDGADVVDGTLRELSDICIAILRRRILGQICRG